MGEDEESIDFEQRKLADMRRWRFECVQKLREYAGNLQKEEEEDQQKTEQELHSLREQLQQMQSEQLQRFESMELSIARILREELGKNRLELLNHHSDFRQPRYAEGELASHGKLKEE